MSIEGCLGWLHFLSRSVHKCSRRCLESSKEGILSIAFLELFHTTWITPHCPFHESSPSIRHWMGCKTLLSLQIGLKCSSMRMTLDLLHEFANMEVFCFFHNCMWQSRHSEVNVYVLAQCEQTDGLIHFQQVSPFSPWSASTSSHLSSYLSTSWTDTGTQLLTCLPVLTFVLSQPNKMSVDFLSNRTGWLLTL